MAVEDHRANAGSRGPRSPRAPLGRLRRPDGRWQIGVGPGARLVDEAVPQALAESVVRGVEPTAAGLACPVLGSGSVAGRLRRALGDLEPHLSTDGLTVIVHQYVVPLEVGLHAAVEARRVLPVVVQPRRIVIGPVTGPPPEGGESQDPEHPCLHCLDLHRRDRDPSWAGVASAMGHPAHDFDPLPVNAALAMAAEGLTLMLAATALAGRYCSPGLAYELGSAAPHVVARRWTIHPACAWHRQDPLR